MKKSSKYFVCVSEKVKLQSLLLLLTVMFSQVTLAYDLGGYKNVPTKLDQMVKPIVKPIAKPSVNDESCECVCINEKWVCTPAGTGCNLTGACLGGLDDNSVFDLNSRSIDVLTQPGTTNPTREITLPGGQFKK